eukprot:9439-Eustigmatos_ZCMA.PRE.1
MRQRVEFLMWPSGFRSSRSNGESSQPRPSHSTPRCARAGGRARLQLELVGSSDRSWSDQKLFVLRALTACADDVHAVSRWRWSGWSPPLFGNHDKAAAS